MEVGYTYRFANGDEVTVALDESDHDLLSELDHQLRNHQRKETRRHTSLEGLGDGGLPAGPGDDPAAIYEAKEALEALGKALEALSLEQRGLIREVFFEDVAPSRIARREGVGAAAISHRISRSLEKLRKLLK
jgi:RNA polymerase sigma-70 factor (ECF subfamily)